MMNQTFEFPDQQTIEAAHNRIRPHIHRTPVLTSKFFNQLTGGEVFFKCENFQKTGSFKIRGACNAVFSLDNEQALKGVATHSSGNHAQALSLAANLRGIKAYVVMPMDSSKAKIAAVREYGGKITFCKPTLQSREEMLQVVIARTKATEIHPYNNLRIIAGQATAAIELLQDVHDLDIILAPVGGGGLLSGTALAVTYFSPFTRIIAAEPEEANDAYLSLKAGHIVPAKKPVTVADGLRTALGTFTFPIIQKHVENIVTVREDQIIEAMKLVWERMKIVVEPSAAVTVAALVNEKIDVKGKRAGVIICGGNVDLDHLPWKTI
ncbi:MAG: pyridoxal-phosphate dependent enzyme [Bacteroidales bacterium]|nr:pyridoxal-phosphate dependent enzyme [Bacteroidales bacterium]MDZ4205147.1 pyridoxal-phosphate dependent enzyme [Bacteroidales bacterium]